MKSLFRTIGYTVCAATGGALAGAATGAAHALMDEKANTIALLLYTGTGAVGGAVAATTAFFSSEKTPYIGPLMSCSLGTIAEYHALLGLSYHEVGVANTQAIYNAPLLSSGVAGTIVGVLLRKKFDANLKLICDLKL